MERVVTRNVLAHVAAGGQSTVLGFGQTGAGKTYSINQIAQAAPRALFAAGASEVRVTCIELR